MILKHTNKLVLAITFCIPLIYPLPQASPLTNHMVKIKNNIDRKDAYKTKLFMRHYPEEFVVKVNGKEVKKNEETEIVIPDKKFSVEYSYIWSAPWGKITGTKQVSYMLTNTGANPQTIELDFSSWDDEYRIKASGAQPTGVTVIESSGNREKPKKKRKNKKRTEVPTTKKLLSIAPTPLSNQLDSINTRKICAN